MSTKLHGIIILAGYPMRTDGISIGDGLFYVSAHDTAKLIVKYLNYKYKNICTQFNVHGDRFGWSLDQETNVITIYSPDTDLKIFQEVKAFCALLVSHNSEGERIAPVLGILKAENGREVVMFHARGFDHINRPKAGSAMHYKYLAKKKEQ